jgi:hypothetical protein
MTYDAVRADFTAVVKSLQQAETLNPKEGN